MAGRNFFLVTVFLVFILTLSGVIFAQRVIDLDKVWGDMRVLGIDAQDQSGWAVAYGDINGDGYADIIIGASADDPAGSSVPGEVYVIFGSGNPPSSIDLTSQSADITVYGAAVGDECGYAVASGDVNNDGY
ncbi:MAG: FG-GAP repeat protein, partial [Candidatus Aminicenantes bacterium]|nr:FG-GAP repeat protein [Candidatus Aminicenantes bacterium]